MLMILDSKKTSEINTFDKLIQFYDLVDTTGNLSEKSLKVSYVIYEMMNLFTTYTDYDKLLGCSVGLFYNIGSLCQYENRIFTKNEIAKYSYVLLKNILNLGSLSEGCLYYIKDNKEIEKDLNIKNKRLVMALKVADGFIDNSCNISKLESSLEYSTTSVGILKRTLMESNIFENLDSGKYKEILYNLFKTNTFNSLQFKSLMRVLIYPLENRYSDISLEVSYLSYLSWVLGKILGLSDSENTDLYLMGIHTVLDEKTNRMINFEEYFKNLNESLEKNKFLLYTDICNLISEITNDLLKYSKDEITSDIIYKVIESKNKDKRYEKLCNLLIANVDLVTREIKLLNESVNLVQEQIKKEVNMLK